MPDRPARPEHPLLLRPRDMPRRGKGGSERGRIALLHALAHIEFTAIDLALDMAGRFGASEGPQFVSDWLSVAADEALHFALLERRLQSFGSRYGALPAHDGLWESAHLTRHDVLARLAIVPMVLEARGLDVTPITVERFRIAGRRSQRQGPGAHIYRRNPPCAVRHSALCKGVRKPRSYPLPKRGAASSPLTSPGPLSRRSTTRRGLQPVYRANSTAVLLCKADPWIAQLTRWAGGSDLSPNENASASTRVRRDRCLLGLQRFKSLDFKPMRDREIEREPGFA